MTEEKSNIPPYIYKRSMVNGFDFYYYLHIRGGSGSKGRSERNVYGGEYDYIVFYASPSEMEGCNHCERIWCRDKGIPYGLGKTIEEAYLDWKAKNDSTQ